ncbi:MAG: class I SAM-dependent methyltransferase [Bacteroidota bacterium]
MKTPLEKAKKGKRIPHPLKWLKYKTWFLLDLPFFIKENGFNTGLELGAKAGRSMFYMLKFNKELFLIGIDKWDVIEGSAYKRNPLNEAKCKRRLKKFADRVKIIQNDALKVAKSIDDQSLDFVHYDLQCKAMLGKHEEMIKLWTTKIRDGGLLNRRFKSIAMENKILSKESKGFHRFFHLKRPYPFVYAHFQLLRQEINRGLFTRLKFMGYK